ncbi:MAG: Dyp-type peroxidase [Actinomycetes bacterium]
MTSSETDIAQSTGLSRRSLLRAGGVGALVVGGVAAGLGTGIAPAAQAASGTTSLPFFGPNQAGVTTPAQQHLTLAVIDLQVGNAFELRTLLKQWTLAANQMSKGQPVGALSTPDSQAPADSGEVVDENAARLTLTFGLGPSMFDSRFGFTSKRPLPLSDLPVFSKDQLDPQRTGGDVFIQACADSAQVADHAVRNLIRIAGIRANVRWIQRGFLDVGGAPGSTGGTPRNLLGFKDGTSNLNTNDSARMANNVWASMSESPAWMAGGSYAVIRRVRTLVEPWDNASLKEQEDVHGRRKYSGAPFGGTAERDRVETALLPIHSHVRVANPRNGAASENERILRRGFNYSDGLAPITGPIPNDEGQPVTGLLDMGLMFIAFQRDPRAQFVPIQTRLDANDALNEYLVHTGSGVFAILPGVLDTSDYLGSTLLDGPRPTVAPTPTTTPAVARRPVPKKKPAPRPRRRLPRRRRTS